MKHIVAFLVAVLFVCLIPFSTSAFSYTDIPEKEISNLKENIKIEKLDSFSEEDKRAFSCFDISSCGRIVLKIDNGQVIVLNETGEFLYGYTLQTYGDIGVGWESENVVIYFVRSDIAVVLSEEADILSIKKIANTVENNSYWNQSVYAKKRICGESTYVMKNSHSILDLFGSGTVLQKEDANGDVSTLYDASNSFDKSLVISTVVFIVVLCVLATIFFPMLNKQIKKRTGSRTGNSSAC